MTDFSGVEAFPGRGSSYTAPRPDVDPRDFVGAAFRQQNPVWSFLSDQRNQVFPPEDGYNPLTEIRGSKYEGRYSSRFYGSLSRAETQAIQAQIDREEKDREISAAAGWGGTIAEFLAGTLDPTLALPGGAVVRGVRGGYSIGRSALSAAVAGAAQGAAQEAVLQSSQATRTLEESAMSIGTGALLGAIIGGSASAFLSRAETVRAQRNLDGIRADMAEHHGLPYTKEADAYAAAGARDPLMDVPPGDAPLAPGARVGEIVDQIQPSAVGRAESVGAAAVDLPDVKPVSILGQVGLALERVPIIRDIMVGTNPVTRTNFSDNVVTRRVSADLAESGTVMRDHLEGRPTVNGAAAETHIRVIRETMQAEATDIMTDAFVKYRFGDQAPRMAGTMAKIEDWRGTAPDKMTRKQFAEAVTVAMRNGDRSEVSAVQEAARAIRARVMDPLWEAAKKVFPTLKDMDRATAESYMKRQWNQRAMQEDPVGFADMVTGWLRGEQEHNLMVQGRVSDLYARMQTMQDMLDTYQQRIARLEQREADLSTRLSERNVGLNDGRVDTLKERADLIREQIAELETTIAEFKDAALGPKAQARLAELEQQYRALQRQERPVTQEDLLRAEAEETAGILHGDLRLAAEMVTGKRRVAEAPSFLHWVAREGGIADDTGDAAAGLRDYRVPGLLRQGQERSLMGGKRSLDDWGERLAEMDPTRRGPGGEVMRYSPDEVMRIFEDAARGQPPQFWIDTLPEKQQAKLRASQIAGAMDEALTRMGVKDPDMQQIAMLWRGETVAGRTLEDLDAQLRWMEETGNDIPVSIRREQAGEQVVATRAAMSDARAAVRQAIAARDAKRLRAASAEGAVGEAEFGMRRTMGRIGILNDRAEGLARTRGALEDFVGSLAREIEDMRGRLETEVGAWRGDTIKEAQAAWKARDKAAEGRAPDQPRLRAADGPTEAAAKRILADRLDMSDAELRARAYEIKNRLEKLPDGRLPYDEGGGGGGPRFGLDPDMARWQASGPLAERAFMIPDNLAQKFLVNDADHLISSYVRQIVPDTVLGAKFGDPMMTLQIKAMREEYDRLIAEAPNAKERARLTAAKEADERDIAGMRDRLRGTYGLPPDDVTRNIARWARAARNVNTVVNMGSVAGYALGDAANAIFRVGMGPAFEAWTGTLRAMAGNGELAARVKREYRAMGAGLEAYQASRMHALDDVANSFHNDTAFERVLSTSAERMNLINLNAHATNFLKVAAGSAVSDAIMDAAQKVARGSASQKDIAKLAASGIDEAMARRMATAFDAAGGEKIDGLFLPNTEDWTDLAAKDAFRSAVAREINMAVITPGQDKPLWFSNQAFGVLGQFKSYMAAFHSRVLLPNLQVQDAKTLQGLFGATMAGMMGYALMSTIQGRDMSKMTASDWMKEGLSRGGVFGWLEEGNGMLSKVSGGSADLYNLIGATPKESSRYESRNVVGALLGPTAGKIQSLADITRGLTSGEWTAKDTRAVRQITPLQNLIYIRGLVDQIERSANDMLGVPNPQPR